MVVLPFPNLDLDKTLEVAMDAAVEAGRVIMTGRNGLLSVKRKSGFDIVTNVDLKAQRFIIKKLKRRFHDHAFLAEEHPTKAVVNRGRYEWVVDPLDGTINYVSGLPLFSVSLALRKVGKPILGVVFNPVTNDFYTAIEGQGSYLNARKLAVSRTSNIADAVFSFMLTSHYDEEQVSKVLRIVRGFATKCRGLRLYVSQALELAFVASGQLDGVIGSKSRGFSSGAGILLVRESGGRVTDLSGKHYDIGSRSLLATNGHLHRRVLQVLHSV